MDTSLARLRSLLHGVADQLEVQATTVRSLRSSIAEFQSSVMATSRIRANLMGYEGSPEQLEVAFDEWLGLRRFEDVRRSMIEALHDPLDDVPRS